MKCAHVRARLVSCASGELHNHEEQQVQAHLSRCASCASLRDSLESLEAALRLDEKIEPSADLATRFHNRLETHRAGQSAAPSAKVPWRHRFQEWSHPRQAAAVVAAALLLVGVILLGKFPTASPPSQELSVREIPIVENFALFSDMKIIQNLELLEDFDAIEAMSTGMGSPSPTPQ